MTKIFATMFAVVLSAVLVSVLYTYPLMLAIGVLHSYWKVVPAFGFFETFVVYIAYRAVALSFVSGKSS